MSDKLGSHQYYKNYIKGQFIVEFNIFQLRNVKDYPNNIKYRLICTDIRNNRKILFDNHKPKGHHYHIDEKEYLYNFISEIKLIDDFKQLVLEHFGVIL
ncbi:MAG TPA: hypothetical protein DC049_01490 [Spirochaetia bacterium]|nr:hypothetical protein [Spirochaetia bacterium]